MITFEEAKNIKELAEFASGIWHEFWPVILSRGQIDYMVEKFQSENAIENQIKYENYTYFYILNGADKAGYMGISQKEGYLFLSKLYIKKEFRHLGIGKFAFEFLKEIAKGKKIVLTVNKYNKNTIAVYKKWGFKTVDSVVSDIGGGFVMDDYIMEYK